jgi:hypothetical protein
MHDAKMDDLLKSFRVLQLDLRNYVFEQAYCSINGPIKTHALDDIVIVRAHSPNEANRYMEQFVTFFKYDCALCVPRWLPQYDGDEVSNIADVIQSNPRKGIKVHEEGVIYHVQ